MLLGGPGGPGGGRGSRCGEDMMWDCGGDGFVVRGGCCADQLLVCGYCLSHGMSARWMVRGGERWIGRPRCL